MLQDLEFGYLDNQYHYEVPRGEDVIVCVQKNQALIRRDSENRLYLPTWEQVQNWSGSWDRWLDEPVRYAFSLQGVRYFLWMGEAGMPDGEEFAYEPINGFRQMICKNSEKAETIAN